MGVSLECIECDGDNHCGSAFQLTRTVSIVVQQSFIRANAWRAAGGSGRDGPSSAYLLSLCHVPAHLFPSCLPWGRCPCFCWLDGTPWNFAYGAAGQPWGSAGRCVTLCTRSEVVGVGMNNGKAWEGGGSRKSQTLQRRGLLALQTHLH